MIKRPRQLPAILLVVLTSAVGTAARSSIDGQTYSNTDYGFQVTAPAGWSIEQNIGAALVLLQSPDGEVAFRVFIDLMSSLDTPADHREKAKGRYGIRGRETTVQELIEEWEGQSPEYLPLPGAYRGEEEPVGELDHEALPPEGGEDEGGDGAETGMDDPTGEAGGEPMETVVEGDAMEVADGSFADADPDAGEVIIEEMTVMEGLIALQQTTGVPYKDAAARELESEQVEEQTEQLDDLAAVLRELAASEPRLTTYDHSVTDPTSGATTNTRHIVCYLLRNTVGYTIQASVPKERFRHHLRDLIAVFTSMRIPALEGGRYGRADAIEMDPQTTGVITGRVLIRGTAVPGATVALYRTRDDYISREPYKTTTSNFIGEFQLVGVPPGTYFLLEADAELGEERLGTFQPLLDVKVRRGFASFVNLELERVE
ncbi:MAG: hypothetical protein GF403_09640 [Candidatus Coatesbacteria bacterium]|nr:hypothetical protein [Candidatus Coatesbacteria bacterium]